MAENRAEMTPCLPWPRIGEEGRNNGGGGLTESSALSADDRPFPACGEKARPVATAPISAANVAVNGWLA